MKKIAVLGSGFVGLTTGASFASVGNKVICSDVDQDKIDCLSRGEMPFYEPDLDKLVGDGIRGNRLRFTLDNAEAITAAEIIFLAVPTPQGDDGAADLSYLKAAAEDIGRSIDSYKIVVIKSTAPIQAVDVVRDAILSQRPNHDFDVVVNPETLREGVAVEDFKNPDQIILGVESSDVAEIMSGIYKPFSSDGTKLVVMAPREAALVKYFANDLLARRINYVNAIARICDSLGLNFNNIRQGVFSDSRLGFEFTAPGPGFGGSCFPKDTPALELMLEELSVVPKGFFRQTTEQNQLHKEYCAQKVLDHFGGDLSGINIGVWGCAFKADTSDMRKSSFITMADKWLEAGAKISVCDPEALGEAQELYGDRITYFQQNERYAALKGASAMVLLTEWEVFKTPDWDLVKDSLTQPRVFDFRNVYSPALLEEKGFDFYVLGSGQS